MIAGKLKVNSDLNLTQSQVFITQDGSKLQVKLNITTKIYSMDSKSTLLILYSPLQMTIEFWCGIFTMNQEIQIMETKHSLYYPMFLNGQE
jgi:hypothetical protein